LAGGRGAWSAVIVFSVMFSITPYGAAGEVTGSAYLVRTKRCTVLVDFGMFQGDKEDDARNVVPGDIHRADIDAVLLTHAHLDHCGRLPLLVRDGYRKHIYGTEATRDLVELVLTDAAHIQEMDFERRQRQAKKRGHKLPRTEAPLFDADDVRKVLSLFRLVEYNLRIEVAPGLHAEWIEAGHMLGSASIVLETTNERVVFSGDVGHIGLPYLRDPEPPSGPFNIVVCESTYGDRNHQDREQTLKQFSNIMVEAVRTNGKVLIPSFAIGRSQNMLYHLAELFRTKVIPRIPIYLDSPMAIEASEIYAIHADLFDDESTELIEQGEMRRDLRTVRFVYDADESRAINDAKGPYVVIAGAGMCNAGRILHHLRHHISDPLTHVVITGYQAHGSLGRKLVEGAEHITIMGEHKEVNATIHTLGGLSAHADQAGLMRWLTAVLANRDGRTPHVLLTHGEDDARDALGTMVAETFDVDVVLPFYGISLELQA